MHRRNRRSRWEPERTIRNRRKRIRRKRIRMTTGQKIHRYRNRKRAARKAAKTREAARNPEAAEIQGTAEAQVPEVPARFQIPQRESCLWRAGIRSIRMWASGPEQRFRPQVRKPVRTQSRRLWRKSQSRRKRTQRKPNRR